VGAARDDLRGEVLEFRSEIFNVPNHRFSLPVTPTAASRTYGMLNGNVDSWGSSLRCGWCLVSAADEAELRCWTYRPIGRSRPIVTGSDREIIQQNKTAVDDSQPPCADLICRVYGSGARSHCNRRAKLAQSHTDTDGPETPPVWPRLTCF
jgi:hypothetical protein